MRALRRVAVFRSCPPLSACGQQLLLYFTPHSDPSQRSRTDLRESASTTSHPKTATIPRPIFDWMRLNAESGSVRPGDEGAEIDLVDVGVAAEGHRQLELVGEHLEAARDALLAHRAEPVDEGATDHRPARAERPGLQDVLPRADAAVHPDLDLRADRVGDRRQCADARRRAVELATAVVGDDDRIGAG